MDLSFRDITEEKQKVLTEQINQITKGKNPLHCLEKITNIVYQNGCFITSLSFGQNQHISLNISANV